MRKENQETPTPQPGEANFYENCVYRNGTIINAKGKEVNVKNGVCRIKCNGKIRTLMVARIVYEAFSKTKVKTNEIICYKDGNKENYNYENLYIIKRKEYFSGYDWDSKKKLTQAVAESIRKSYRRGRTNLTDQCDNTGPTHASLAKEYGVSISTIRKVLNGTY